MTGVERGQVTRGGDAGALLSAAEKPSGAARRGASLCIHWCIVVAGSDVRCRESRGSSPGWNISRFAGRDVVVAAKLIAIQIA